MKQSVVNRNFGRILIFSRAILGLVVSSQLLVVSGWDTLKRTLAALLPPIIARPLLISRSGESRERGNPQTDEQPIRPKPGAPGEIPLSLGGLKWQIWRPHPGSAGAPARKRGDTLIPTLSHMGLTGVGLRPLGARAPRPQRRAQARRHPHPNIIPYGAYMGRFATPGSAGVPARNAARKRGDTLILAFSHKGRRDPLTAIYT